MLFIGRILASAKAEPAEMHMPGPSAVIAETTAVAGPSAPVGYTRNEDVIGK